MKTENLQKVIEFLNSNCNADIDFSYHLSGREDEIETAEDIQSILDDANAFDVEIIYYSNAIKYLSNNDPSLRESLSLAADMGYTADNINSEILASILASSNAREEYSEIESELEDLLQEIKEEEEEEEEETEE